MPQNIVMDLNNVMRSNSKDYFSCKEKHNLWKMQFFLKFLKFMNMKIAIDFKAYILGLHIVNL